MERRRLGRTGHMSTVVTFGTAALSNVTQSEADAAVELVLRYDVNHFDVAPTYGEAELRIGPWMPRIRQQIFLGCKTQVRDREGARAELERSLQRLQTDRFDLYQLHAVNTMEDLDQATARGGALEAIVAAREQGLTRWIGITGHGHQAPTVHLEALRRFDFDTVMLPYNFVLAADPAYREAFERLMAECRARDVGVHILKALAKAPWGDRPHTYTTWYEPIDDQATIDRAVAFVLSHPMVTTLCSTGDLRILPRLLEAAERYRPPSEQEQRELVAAGAHAPYASPFVD